MARIHMESLGIGEEPEDKKKAFTLYWRTGHREVIYGTSIDNAFIYAGYGNGAVRALDWYDNGYTETHTWNKDSKVWVKNT